MARNDPPAATGLTLAEIYADDEYVLRGDGGGGFEVSYPRSRKTPRRVIGHIRKGEFFPASEWREPTGRDRGQAGRDDVDFLTGKRTAPDPPAARVYRVEPESEPLTAAEYLRAQADFTQSWIDTDAARALNPADIAVSKDLADASLEVLAEMDALERARDEAFALLGEAYTGEYPSNRWRKRVEDLGAWPVKP